MAVKGTFLLGSGHTNTNNPTSNYANVRIPRLHEVNAASTAELIGHIYDWAASPHQTNLSKALAEAVDCNAAAIFCLDTDSRHLVIKAIHSPNPDSLLDTIDRHVVNGRYDPALDAPAAGGFATLAEIVQTVQQRIGPKDQGFSLPPDHPNVGLGVAPKNDSLACMVLLQRDHDRPFDAQDKRLLATLLPHIGTAVRMRKRLLDSLKIQAAYEQLMHCAPYGCFFFDTDGHELFRNAAAEKLVDNDSDLSCEGRPVIHIDRLGQAKLDAQACQRLKLNGGAGQSSVPLHISNQPLGANFHLTLRVFNDLIETGDDPENRIITATIFDSNGQYALRTRDLQALYDFTPAETHVCQLLYEGRSLAGIADQLSVTRHTVKAHLSHSFKKVGVTNQANLLRKLGLSIG